MLFLVFLWRCYDELPPALCKIVVILPEVVFMILVEGLERVIDLNPEIYRCIIDVLALGV